ncbi:MAG: hypothetical protein DRP78_05610, partial [Candidatus Omnitrophota bacterium]
NTSTGLSYSDTGLTANTSYSYRVLAYDAAGNESGQCAAVSAATEQAPDTTPPVRSNGAPSGELAAGTTEINLSLNTNEMGTCKYSTTSGIEYSGMTDVFETVFALGSTVAHITSITGLADGNSYSYYVKCQDSASTPNVNTDDFEINFNIANAADTESPSVPSGLSLSVVSSAQIDLSWSASTDNVGVTGYKIYRDGSEINTSTGVSYSDTGLTASTSYSYTVSAYDAAGNESSQCSAVSAATEPAPDTTPPVRSNGTPTGELAAGTAGTTLSLNTDETAVCKYWTSAGVSYDDMANIFNSTDSTSHSQAVTGLSDGNSYIYYVKCQDTSVNQNTNIDDFEISFNIAEAGDTTAPTVPADLQATASSSTEIDLIWTASTDNVGVTGYKIFRDGTEISTSTGLSYSDTGLTASTSYSYTVSAYDAAENESEQTDGVSASTQVSTVPCMLTDFETGENTNGLIGGGTGYFRHQSGTENHLPVVSPGAVETNYCVEYITEAWELAENGDHPQSFYIDNPNSRTLIEEASGANRMCAWVKLPDGYIQSGDRNFHFGTYTRDPEIPSNSAGIHFYHTFSIPGSTQYWTKIIANEHPQARSGDNDEIGNNPTNSSGWDYYDGFTRFYFHTKGGIYPTPGTWSWFIDEVKFYQEAESEDVQNVTSISCTYFGEGHFQINWHGDLRVESNSHHYELRYSTSLITNANYSSAAIAPGCSDLTKVSESYNLMSADFTIPITTGTAYFAIKDLDSVSSYVSKIDYFISEINDETAPVRSNGNPTGNLSSGTTSTSISLTTNETADCKYGPFANVAYADLPNTFNNTNSTSHSQTITGLSDGQSYTYYVRCQDTAENVNTDDFTISFSIANAAPDTTPPLRTNAFPQGEIDAGTIEQDISLSTNENATCKYAATAGTSYANMTQFTNTTSLNHTTQVSGLKNGVTCNYYVKCKDSSDNINSDDFVITFSVADAQRTNNSTSSGGKSCFIATAAYGTPLAEQVKVLSRFRDKHLLTNYYGQTFVNMYYKYSPKIAEYISHRDWARSVVRLMLSSLVNLIR